MIGTKRVWALVAGGMVAGVILGSVSSGFAVTTTAANTSAQAVAACGLGLGQAMRGAGGTLLDAVAKLTGQTPAQVASQRAAGKSISQIAAEKNVSATAVVDQALKVRQQVLADKVKAGAITQSQADAAAATMKSRLTQRVSDPTACNGSGGGAGRGAGGRADRGSGGGGGGCGSCSANQ